MMMDEEEERKWLVKTWHIKEKHCMKLRNLQQTENLENLYKLLQCKLNKLLKYIPIPLGVHTSHNGLLAVQKTLCPTLTAPTIF